MLTPETLASLRQTLEEERERLQTQVREMAGDDFDENFADSAQVAAEQGEHRTLTESLEEQLTQVQAALERMDEGTFGLCEVDEEPIAPARLEAFPTARRCMDHSEG